MWLGSLHNARLVGEALGLSEGLTVGPAPGDCEGLSLGDHEGPLVGAVASVGFFVVFVGEREGLSVGSTTGTSLGEADGDDEGDKVGASVLSQQSRKIPSESSTGDVGQQSPSVNW